MADSAPPSNGNMLRCQWLECTEAFADAEALFSHLCDQHVGRKSSGNLSLTCFWKGCNTTCSKRDHITSHMRVHTPLKPHACVTCGKAFKRPQDLRKHEKIHTEEHHARHKQSKAITVPSSIAPAKPAHHQHNIQPNPSGLNGHSTTSNGITANTFNHAAAHHQQQQHQVQHSQASMPGMSHMLNQQQQQQQSGHLLKPPQSNNTSTIDLSPGPPSTLNPNAVGNQSSNAAAAHPSVSPPGTAGATGATNFFPFMLPYPYAGYGMPTPEQQAGLAELLIQQQRLNAAAAQLIGMPPQMQQQQGQANSNNMQNNQYGAQPAAAAGGVPPYSLLFPGLLGNFQHGAQQQLYQNYQQQYGSFAPAPQAQQQPVQHQQQQQSKPSAQGLYPDLDDLMKNENMPPPVHSNGHYTSSGSASYNRGGQGYHAGHTRSDSSNGASPVSSHNYHSVSPQPPAYMPSSAGRHHVDYNQQQQQYPYGGNNNNSNGSHLFQNKGLANGLHHGLGGGNTVLGKGKRSFESEADTLLNDLKKKRFDGTNGSQFEQRLDSLSSYLFDSDPTFSEGYSTSLPSVTVDSTQSPSDRSSHSSTSNFSPRSASGSVKSPAEIALDLSKSDIDDINHLLFSFGQPYESPATADISKNAISWPGSAITGGAGNQPLVNGTDFTSLPALNSNTGHLSSSNYVDFIADANKTSPASTTSNATATQQQQNNTHIYPSLSGLSSNKPIKPLPNSNTMLSNYMQQSQPLAMPLHHIAPARSIPTPYIASDIAREPQMTTIPLLSRAPPADRLPPLLMSRNRIVEEGNDDGEMHHMHSKSGVSSLRSTMNDEIDGRSENSEGRTAEEEAAMQLAQFHTQRQYTPRQSTSPSPSTVDHDEGVNDDVERITLPPIGQPDHRGSECHLPSLRSLLANDPVERYEPRYRPSASISSSAATESISSPPSTAASSSLSHSHSAPHHAQKRATPSRQFYPSLSSLAMRDEPSSYASTSTSSSSTEFSGHHHHHHQQSSYHHRRPSTGDKLNSITRGVGTFRMDSYDEEVDAKSESDDDMSPDAVYKRSRQRTRGPTPPMYGNSSRIVRSPSAMSEEDELASDREDDDEEDVKPVIHREAFDDDNDGEGAEIPRLPTREEMIHKKRLAVIHALVARANALYREQMARKRHYPALIRVKEEELE